MWSLTFYACIHIHRSISWVCFLSIWPCNRASRGRPPRRDLNHLQVLPTPQQGCWDETQVLCSSLSPNAELCWHTGLQAAIRGVCSGFCQRHRPAQLCVAGWAHSSCHQDNHRVLPVGHAAEWCSYKRYGESWGWWWWLWWAAIFRFTLRDLAFICMCTNLMYICKRRGLGVFLSASVFWYL